MRKKSSLTALVMAVSILLSLSLWVTKPVQAVDLDKTCTLTVEPGTIEDLKNASVVIDLYKIADAKPDPTYDTYSYEATGFYQSLQNGLEEQMDNDAWRKLAVAAAQIALDTDTPAATTKAGEPVGELECGLYLMLARGEKMKKDEYTSKNEEDELVTLACSPDYVYRFFPELVSLPSTSDLTGVPGQVIKTSDGEWLYEISATLKPSQDVRFGSLEIVKNLTDYQSADPAVFVFQVDAYRDENKTDVVYSDVVSVHFTAAGEQRILLEKRIPVGAYVEVTEVYSGTAYTVSDSEPQTAVIDAVDTMSVHFTNVLTGGGNRGGGVINQFSYDPAGEGSWNWEPWYSEQQ
ncbi:hypothetical protein [Hominifimenecus sp. rT4P-3]|uniref:hypothetical protein n=1 Tax=Hominifimenecus sp. rT4P-3 TaxID=3242979 RepID=UPI003DA550C9